MKAYLDSVAVAGKSFKYTAEGPVGLLTDKKRFIFKRAEAFILKVLQLIWKWGIAILEL